MGTIKLTSYGSSLRGSVKIDGFVLTSVYYNADEIYLLDVISDLTYSDLYFDETNCQGNVYPDGGGRVRVKDDSDSEYVAYSMLFYTNYESEKKIVAVLTSDQNDYVISKNSDAINKFINLDLSVFQYGVSFSSYVSGSRIATQNSDGLLHIDDPNTSIDDSYSVYSKSQVDGLVSNFVESSDIPTNVSAFQNDAGYISQIKTINNQSLIGTGNITITAGSDYATYIGNSAENYVAYSNNVASGGKALLPYADASDSTGYVDLGNSANRWRAAYIKDTIHLYDNSARISGQTNLLRLHAQNGSNTWTSITTDIISNQLRIYSYTGSTSTNHITHDLIDATPSGVSLYDNHVNIASTETTFNKNVDLVLAKDTNTYIYSGNILSGNDYRHWWANYDQVSMSYTSISISMTEETSADSTLEVPINELSSVIPFGKLIVGASDYSISIGVTSVTDSLKDLIESDSISPSDSHIFLCFDSSTPTNIIGVVICAESNQGQTTSENLMFFIPSDDLEIVDYQYNPSQGIYFIVNSSDSYSLNNDYYFYYSIISKKRIRDYLDNKIESRINQGVTNAEYSTYASQVGVYGANNDTDYPLIFTSSVTSSIYGLIYKNVYTDTSNDLYYNPSTNTLTCSTFSGNLTGNVTGNVTGNADSASKLKLLGNNTDESYPIVFAESVNTNTAVAFSKSLYTDNVSNFSLKYNPNKNICYCDTFNGAFELPSTSSVRFFSNATNFYTKITQGQGSTQSEISISGYDSDNTRQSTLVIANNSVSSGTSAVLPSLGSWGLGSSAYRWKNVYADFFNGTPVIPQGNASWNSSTHVWSVSCTPALTSLTLGSIICVYFSTSNSYSGSMLDVNGLGAKTIYIRSGVTAGTTVNTSWPNGSYVLLRYNGTYWYVLNTNSYPTSTASGTTNIIPSADNSYDLGSSSYRWNNLYTYYVGDSSTKVQYGYFNYCSISTLRNGSNSNLATLTTAGIIPTTDSTSSTTGFDLGSSSYKWKCLYISGGHSNRHIIIDNSGGEPTIRPDRTNYGYLGTSSYHWYDAYINNLYVGQSAVPLPPISGRSNTQLGSIQFLRVAIPVNTTTGIVSAGTALSSSSYTLMLVTASTNVSALIFRNNTEPSGTWTTLTDMYYYNTGSSLIYTYVLAYKSA